MIPIILGIQSPTIFHSSLIITTQYITFLSTTETLNHSTIGSLNSIQENKQERGCGSDGGRLLLFQLGVTRFVSVELVRRVFSCSRLGSAFDGVVGCCFVSRKLQSGLVMSRCNHRSGSVRHSGSTLLLRSCSGLVSHV